MTEALSDGVLQTLIDSYVKLRDKKEALIKEQKLHVKQLQDVMDEIEGFLRGHLKQQKVTSISSEFATAFLNRQRSATLADSGMFREHVIATGNFELADFRPSKDAVETYISEHNGHPPPGVNWSIREVVQVQRK